jgi:hypothetical protein
MGTRGLAGFVVDGVEKIGYVHWDSYPSGLGSSVVEAIQAQPGLEELRAKAKAIEVVGQGEVLSPQWRARLGVSADVTAYDALRDDQGDLSAALEKGLMVGGAEAFGRDSLYCEWGYVVDLDEGVLEVYEGFVNAPHSEGRFAAPDAVKVMRQEESLGTAYHQVIPVLSVPLTTVLELREVARELVTGLTEHFREGLEEDEETPEAGTEAWKQLRRGLQDRVDALATLGPEVRAS